MQRCIIQVQYVGSNGIPINNWQDINHITNPSPQLITSEMLSVGYRMINVRVRAIDESGRLVDIMPFVR
jgi:hypothetical protein